MSEKVKLPLKTVLVGCGGMGRAQAKILKSLAEYELVAVCDISEAVAKATGELLGVRWHEDFTQALAKETPDVVAICTGNTTHATLTIQAAKAGVKAVYCEKPMATCLADARAMTEACQSRRIPLIINHQRRIGPDLLEARRLIQNGAIGTLRCIRTQNAGDILSDGTHAVDSALWLSSEAPIKWVLGQVHRNLDDMAAHRAKANTPPRDPVGYRFGHVVESGGLGIMEDANGVRIEIFCGDMVQGYSAYQDYEIIGTHGRLWRTGDQARPNLFLQDAQGGTWSPKPGDYPYRPQPNPDHQRSEWRPVELPEESSDPLAGIPGGYRRLVQLLQDGTPHPMAVERARPGFEVVMAIYESARLHRKITLPLEQDRFPLELMLA